MKKMYLLLVLCCLPLSGCISSYGQYRGAANGIEITRTGEDLKVNVSGGAKVTINADGSISGTSNSNLDTLAQILKLTQTP